MLIYGNMYIGCRNVNHTFCGLVLNVTIMHMASNITIDKTKLVQNIIRKSKDFTC